MFKKGFSGIVFWSMIPILAVILSACKVKEIEPHRHKGPVETVRKDDGWRLSSQETELREIYARRFELIRKIHRENVSEKELYDVLSLVQPFIINPFFIENQQTSGSLELQTALFLFNASLKKLLKINPESIRRERVLEVWEKIFFEGCNEDLEGCFKLPFFLSDPGTVTILRYRAEQLDPEITRLRREREGLIAEINAGKTGYKVIDVTDTDDQKQVKLSCQDALKKVEGLYFLKIDRYFRYLYLCYEYGGPGSGANLVLLYLKHSQDYFTRLKGMPHGVRTTASYRRHHDILNTILRDSQFRNGNKKVRKEYCDFLFEIKPFEIEVSSRSGMNSEEVRRLVTDFISCAARQRKLETIIEKHLRKEEEEFQAVASMENDEKHFSNRSFYGVQASLGESTSIVKAPGIERKFRKDLTFFIIDRLFYDRVDPSTAMKYWISGRGKDDLEFMKALKNYIRIQIAFLVKKTFSTTGNVLRDEYEKRGNLGADFIADVAYGINKRVKTDWDSIKRRLQFLRGFLIQIFDGKYNRFNGEGSGKKVADYYLSLKEELEAAPEHINYLVTSPLMLALSYYMSKSQGPIKFYVSWWSGINPWFTMDGSQALTTFFTADSGYSRRLFKFGEEYFNFDELQKFMAFDYGLRAGIFKYIPFGLCEEDQSVNFGSERIAFSEDASKFNEYLFFRQYFQDTLLPESKRYIEESNELKKLLEASSFGDRFSGACRNPLTAPMTMDINAIYSSTLLESAFSGDESFTRIPEKTYTGSALLFSRRIEFERAKSLVSLLENYFYGEGAKLRVSPEKFKNRELIMKAVRAELNAYEKPVREYFKMIKKLDEMIVNNERDCLMRLTGADVYRQNRLFDLTIDFYKDVHAAMLLLRHAENVEGPVEPGEYLRGIVSSWMSSDMHDNKENQGVATRMEKLIAKISNPPFWSRVKGGGFMKKLENALNDLSGIHNFDGEPFVYRENDVISSEIGFFVTGVPTFQDSNKEIKHSNRITASHFAQSKWDTMLRLRRELERGVVPLSHIEEHLGDWFSKGDVSDFIVTEDYGKGKQVLFGAALEIPMGSFSDVSRYHVYNNENIHRVLWNDKFDSDQTAFVKAAMSGFAGHNNGSHYIGWYSPSGAVIPLLMKRFSFLLGMFRNGAIDISDPSLPGCQKDVWGDPIISTDGAYNEKSGCEILSYGAEDLIRYFLKIVDFVRLSKYDRENLDWIGRKGKYSELIKEFFKYRSEESTDRWTYFDEFYRNYLTTVDVQTADGRDLKMEALDGKSEMLEWLASMRLNVEGNRHLFDPEYLAVRLRRNSIRKKIVRHLKQIVDVEELIMDIEDAKIDLGEVIFEKSQSPRENEDLKQGEWRYLGIRSRESGERAGTKIYLEDRDKAKTWFHSFVNSFYTKETACAAMPEAGDPDYEIYNSILEKTRDMDCSERYSAFKEYLDEKRKEERNQRRKNPSSVFKQGL